MANDVTMTPEAWETTKTELERLANELNLAVAQSEEMRRILVDQTDQFDTSRKHEIELADKLRAAEKERDSWRDIAEKIRIDREKAEEHAVTIERNFVEWRERLRQPMKIDQNGDVAPLFDDQRRIELEAKLAEKEVANHIYEQMKRQRNEFSDKLEGKERELEAAKDKARSNENLYLNTKQELEAARDNLVHAEEAIARYGREHRIELESARKASAEMRALLFGLGYTVEGMSGVNVRCNQCGQVGRHTEDCALAMALSGDAGRDYVPRSELEKLKQDLEVALKMNAEALATHRCKVCGALWRLNPAMCRNEHRMKHCNDDACPMLSESWSCLTLDRMGKCCDMEPMGEQIEPIQRGYYVHRSEVERARAQAIEECAHAIRHNILLSIPTRNNAVEGMLRAVGKKKAGET